MWKLALVLAIIGIVIIVVAITIAANSTKFNKKCCKPTTSNSSTSISSTSSQSSTHQSIISAAKRGRQLPRSQGVVIPHNNNNITTTTTTTNTTADINTKSEEDHWDVKSVLSSDGHLSSSSADSDAIDNVDTVDQAATVKGLSATDGGGGGGGGEWSWGLRKSRRVLPYSSAHESACMSAYSCSPFTQELVTSGRTKAFQNIKSPCDANVVSIPTPLFDKSHRRYFFGIGINYISQPKNRLTSCWNDIDTLRSEFTKRYGAFDQTWVITDRPKDMRDGLQPTLTSIRKAWKKLMTEAAKIAPTKQHVDVMLVFSGHGTFRLTNDPGELGGQSDALIFLDQLMYDYDVMAQIVRPLGNHVHLLIVFDSCNSGSAANLPWTYNPLSNTVNQTSLHTDLTNDVVMISGCRDEQTSQAGATTADLSECTRVLVETLKENPQVYSLAATDLIKAMRHKLIAAKDTQIPVLSISKPQLLQTLL